MVWQSLIDHLLLSECSLSDPWVPSKGWPDLKSSWSHPEVILKLSWSYCHIWAEKMKIVSSRTLWTGQKNKRTNICLSCSCGSQKICCQKFNSEINATLLYEKLKLRMSVFPLFYLYQGNFDPGWGIISFRGSSCPTLRTHGHRDRV